MTDSLLASAKRKLNDGFEVAGDGVAASLTGAECAAVVDRLYVLEERLEALVDAAKTRATLAHAKPDDKLAAALWTEKIAEFVDAVESADEVLGRGR